MKGAASLLTSANMSERSSLFVGGRLLQRKFAVGVNIDSAELEADRIAEEILAIPEHAEINNNPPIIQRFTGQQTSSSEEAPESVDRVLASPGRRMDPALRQDMEQRFGHDFSKVRVHTDTTAAQSARDINADAYTAGCRIVFGEDQYRPSMRDGRRLIAHELAHVVQQRSIDQDRRHPAMFDSEMRRIPSLRQSPEIVQRKVKIKEELNFDTKGFNVDKKGAIYSAARAITNSSLWNEIFTAILASPRIFEPVGSTDKEVKEGLRDHMLSRLGIVSFAAKRRYSFGVGTYSRMNPTYWKGSNDVFEIGEGVNPQEAREDINKKPSLYSIGCLQASDITMVGGGKSLLKYDSSPDDTDWIPGDWGYIENTAFKPGVSVRGTSGENIIYTGASQYWGHTPDPNSYKSLPKWKAEVAKWDGASRLTEKRDYPQKGLK